MTPMIKRAIILFAMLTSDFALAQQPVDNPPIFQFNQQADASALAEKYAALLKDDPECDNFRLQLAKLAQGSPYDGRTAPQMTQVLRKARAAGCHK